MNYRKWIRFYLILLAITLLSIIWYGSYAIISVSSWGSGCFDAANKIEEDYGLEHKVYMDRFCDHMIKNINNNLHRSSNKNENDE